MPINRLFCKTKAKCSVSITPSLQYSITPCVVHGGVSGMKSAWKKDGFSRQGVCSERKITCTGHWDSPV